jgi:hypothetical protein
VNGTHQLLAYADDVNLQRDNIDTKLTKFRERTTPTQPPPLVGEVSVTFYG